MERANTLWDDLWEESVSLVSSSTLERPKERQGHYHYDQDHRHNNVEEMQNRRPITLPSYDIVEEKQNRRPITLPSYDNVEENHNRRPVTLPSYDNVEENQNRRPIALPSYDNVEENQNRRPVTLPSYDNVEEKQNRRPITLPSYDNVEEKQNRRPITLPSYDNVEENQNRRPVTLPSYDNVEEKQTRRPITLPSYDNVEEKQNRRPAPIPSQDNNMEEKQNRGPIPLLSLSFPPDFRRLNQNGQKTYNDVNKQCTKGRPQHNKSYDNQNNQNFHSSPKYRRLSEENGESKREGYRRDNDERSNHGTRYDDQQKQGDEREFLSRETAYSQLDYEGSNHPRDNENGLQRSIWYRGGPNRESSGPNRESSGPCPRGSQSQDQTAQNMRYNLNSSNHEMQETLVVRDSRNQNQGHWQNWNQNQNENQDLWQNRNQNQESHEGDAADFLLSNSEYNDCYLMVGNPESCEVEGIWAVSVYLISHSPVFREKLKSNRGKDPSESTIHITDVSPTIFRLMLRYVYGGKLPEMTAIDAGRLALCGDKFKIPRLVKKALKRLTPMSVENMFPALMCVTTSTFPELEVRVSRIIQQETDKVVQNGDFLKLSEQCLLYILNQSILNISELELWFHCLRWAKYQVRNNPGGTLRDYLGKAVGYVRFLTFTLEQVMEHVLPTTVLNSDEFLDLTLAVSNMQQLESPDLCKVSKKRSLYRRDDEVTMSAVHNQENRTKNETGAVAVRSEIGNFTKPHIFKPDHYWYHCLCQSGCDTKSTLNVKPSEFIEIVSFTCRSQTVRLCKFLCDVTVSRSVENSSSEIIEVIRVEGIVDNVLIVLPLKFKSGQSLVLSPKETWTFELEFNISFPVFRLYADNDSIEGETDYTHAPLKKDSITVTYVDPFHVTQIEYKTQ